MSGIDWVVKFETGSTLYEIENIQSVQFFTGRQFGTDPFAAGRGTIICRDPSAWGSPVPTMGKRIYVWAATGGGPGYGFNGRIEDISIDYGPVANMDEVTITFEGYLGSVGRYQLTAEAIAQDVTTTQGGAVGTLAGATGTVYGGSSIASGQTYTGNALSLLSEIMLTEVGRIVETTSDATTPSQALLLMGRQRYSTWNPIAFSDVPAEWGTGVFQYSGLEFKSSAENYFTQVTIQPNGLATQKTGAGKFSLVQESVDYTTTQALSHAQYLKSQYAYQTITPYAVTIDYASQVTAAKTSFAVYGLINYYNLSVGDFYTTIGRLMSLKFRGTTYQGVIEGYRVSATPENTRITYYFSPQDVNSYLKWGSGRFYNKWDSNKWGF